MTDNDRNINIVLSKTTNNNRKRMLFVRTFIKNIDPYANVSSEPEKIPRIMIPIPHLVLIHLK